MPYIKEDKRKEIKRVDYDTGGETIWFQNIDTAGDFNYAVSIMIIDYLKRKGLNYQHINDISGALNESLAELRRRVIGKYEDVKILENGDIYEIMENDLKNKLEKAFINNEN